MPRFGFYLQDVIPGQWWNAATDTKQPGEDVGCELAVRHSPGSGGEKEVFVKCIAPAGPAALSGRLAVGDSISEINGESPLGEHSGRTSLAKLMEGQQGEPIWLKVKGAATDVVLIRQDPLMPGRPPAAVPQGDLGISLKEQQAAGSGVEFVITEIKAGGALWLRSLAGLGSEVPVSEGDIITNIDGTRVGSGPANLTGAPFSRISVSGRTQDGDVFEIAVVRAPALPANVLDRVREYKTAVACIPPAPPSNRVNGNQAPQAAPLVNGFHVKDAAQMVVAAYAEEAESTSAKDAPEAAGEDRRVAQGGGASPRAIGARVSPTDVVSALSPELRFNCIAMVCAIYSPSFMLQKKLRLQALRMGRLPRMLELSETAAEAPATPSDGAIPENTNTGVLHWIKKRWSAAGDEDDCNLEHVEQQVEGDWHLGHVKLLSGFMLIEQDREVTLRSILKSQGSSCKVFADYILDASRLDSHLGVDDLPMVPECGTLQDSSDDDTEQGVDDEAQAAKAGGDVDREEEEDDEAQAAKAGGEQPKTAAATSDREDDNRRERSLSICAPCVPGVEQSPWAVCWLVLAASVGSRKYDARARALLRHMAHNLTVPWEWIRCAEIAFCREIIKSSATPAHGTDGGDDGTWSRSKMTRYGLIGGGAVAGGVILAVTGGLAAPALVAGLGVAGAAAAGAGLGAGLAGFAASVAALGGLSAAMAASFGAAGAGLAGYKLHRRIGDVKEFEFDLIDCSPNIPVTIGIHGWLNDDTDSPWKVWNRPLMNTVNDGGEMYALRWETPELRALGQAISKIVESQAQSYVVGAAGTAVIGAAFATLALPLQLMSMMDYVDNSWSVAQQRADKAGEQLARTLLARIHGNRPVTLIGFGMGARMIIKCLLALSEAPDGQGIVETACLLGAPYPADALEWSKASSVCSYRLINAYNSRDWLLGLAYRATSANISGIAGLRNVDFVNGSEAVLENIDLTSRLSPSHFQYRDRLSELVQALGVYTGVVDMALIKPDDRLESLVNSVDVTVPTLPEASLPLREKAALTLDSMRFWRSKDDMHVDTEPGDVRVETEAEAAAAMQGAGIDDPLGECVSCEAYIPPRPHSR